MAGSGRERGAHLDLWGHLRPLRCEAPGDEEESDEDFEEEPLLAEDTLLEAAGRELSAALPPRRSGEGPAGRAARVRCPPCSGPGSGQRGASGARRCGNGGGGGGGRPGPAPHEGTGPAGPARCGNGSRSSDEPVVQGKRGLCSSGARDCNRKETRFSHSS